MKRCPTCNRTFQEEDLSFCPHDGAGLVSDTSSAPVELQATMMATPPSHGGSSYPPPPASGGPGSGSFNPPPPNPSWAPPPPNPSWATPSTPQTSAPPKSGGINKKLIFGGIGCLGLAVIVVIIGIVILVVLSGPSSKMNPYKGDLKALAPENIAGYTRTDVEDLGDKEKRTLGSYNEAIGVSYKATAIDDRVEMLVANYSSAKDAEDGLKTFKAQNQSRGWSISDEASKRIGWRTVGLRFVGNKSTSTGQLDERYLPDGATILFAGQAEPAKTRKQQFVCWTNGSVLFAVGGGDNYPEVFEIYFDKAVK